MYITPRQADLITCKAMRFTRDEGVAWMKSRGHKINSGSYGSGLNAIKKKTLSRIHDIALNQKEHHLERIDNLRLVLKETWRLFYTTEDKRQKAVLLRDIRDIQPFISAYEEMTATIMEQAVRSGEAKKEEPNATKMADSIPAR